MWASFRNAWLQNGRAYAYLRWNKQPTRAKGLEKAIHKTNANSAPILKGWQDEGRREMNATRMLQNAKQNKSKFGPVD